MATGAFSFFTSSFGFLDAGCSGTGIVQETPPSAALGAYVRTALSRRPRWGCCQDTTQAGQLHVGNLWAKG